MEVACHFKADSKLVKRSQLHKKMLVGHWMLHICMRHAGYEHRLRSGIWFESKWSTLIYSTFMIYPFELAKLILDGPPWHPFFQIAQVGARIDVIP